MGLSGNFSSFLTTAMPNDTHPFSFDKHGRPLDYLNGNQNSPPTLLTLFEFCDRIKDGARAAFAAFEETELLAPLPPGSTKEPNVSPGGPI
jgi:hypothetical protein